MIFSCFHCVALLVAVLILNVDGKVLKKSIYSQKHQKKSECTFSSMCTASKNMEKILKEQSKAITEQGKQVESKFKTIEKTIIELTDKIAKLADEIPQQDKSVAMMGQACNVFNTKLTEQVKKMTECFTKSTNVFTKKLETAEAAQLRQTERNQAQDTKINKLEQDQLKTIKDMAQKLAPKPTTPPSFTSALAAGAKARLNVQLLQAETKLNEADARAKSSEIEAQQQDTKILTMETELAAVNQKSKENDAKISNVKLLGEMMKTTSGQLDASLSTLVTNNMDLSGKLSSADSALNVLEMGAKFGLGNIDKLNDKFPNVKEKLFSAESILDEQDQKLNGLALGLPSSPPSPPPSSCPLG